MSANDLADRLDAHLPPYVVLDPGVTRAAAVLLREQAEQLDSLRNAIGDPDESAEPPLMWQGESATAWEHGYTAAKRHLLDALAAAGGGVPEEGATDEQ